MRQFDELLRLISHGVQFDAYLMDAFWFDPDGGYREWRQPNWPDGPQRWLDACAEHALIPGLWFTANTLCHLNLPAAWADSADANEWGLCCFQGGFLADYLNVLDHWYQQGVRIFKLDFADFTAAPPDVKATMPVEEIRRRNEASLRGGLLDFKQTHPGAIFMGFNGFESAEYMDRTDRPMECVLDLKWLEVFDSVYSGDPRPADVPTLPFWRSVDIYGDHATRTLEHSGVPLSRIDNCGFMAGPTGTCYWRGKALWKGMLLLTMVRGGDLTVLYGDLSLFDDGDARWMANAQAVLETAFRTGGSVSFGGIPGEEEPYGWMVGEKICAVINPKPEPSTLDLPDAPWRVLFRDAGFEPTLDRVANSIELGPYQMALLGIEGPNLGMQDDCVSEVRISADYEVIERLPAKLTARTKPGDLELIVRQFDAERKLCRTYSGSESAAAAIRLTVSQDGTDLCVTRHDNRIIWSGMSWAAAAVSAPGGGDVEISLMATDPQVAFLDLEVWRK